MAVASVFIAKVTMKLIASNAKTNSLVARYYSQLLFE